MPFMYPEELAKLRADHPNLQYDGYGNVIGVTQPDSVQMAADAIYQLPGMQPDAWSFGPTRADFQNSKDFVGPAQPQWWNPNGELFQQGQDLLGGFMAGRDLRPRRAARPANPYVRRQAPLFGGQMLSPEVRYRQDDAVDPAYRAELLRQTDQLPFMQQARRLAQAGAAPSGAPFPFPYDDGSGEGPARPAPYGQYEAYGLSYPFSHDDGSGEFVPQ